MPVRVIEDTEREKQKVLSVQSVVQKLKDQKAKRLTEDNRRQWKIWCQTKKATMQGYVGVLALICFVARGLSVIWQKVWEKYGEDICKGIDVWNCPVAVLVLAVLVYFEGYVKKIVSVNLFGIWLLVDILLILAGWYVGDVRSIEDGVNRRVGGIQVAGLYFTTNKL